MNRDAQNVPTQETMTVDGGDLTEQEKALMAQGLEDEPAAGADAEAGAGAGAGTDAGKADGAAAEADKDPNAAAAAAGTADAGAGAADDEATRLAAEQAERDRLAEAAAASQASEAQANAEAIAAAAAAKRPDPPKDFEAEFDELEKKLDDGDIDEAEYRKAARKLGQEEADYKVAITTFDIEQRHLQERAQEAQSRSENAWNAAALQWEADNKAFMENPLRAQRMQEAINLVINSNTKAGKVAAPAAVLAEAGRIAFDFVGWQPPAVVDQPDPKAALATATAARKVDTPGQTLGDAPTAGAEPIRGNEQYANLERLGIEELEEVASRMSQAEQEKWLRDAPGASANGRGD